MKMTERAGMEVSFAAAEAVKLCNVDVISAYPITPQTHIVERLAEYVANGETGCRICSCRIRHSAEPVYGKPSCWSPFLYLCQFPGRSFDE